MSNPLKKIVKGVKKVFKKIVKTVKKVMKSKLFKIAILAAAVYFTAGAVSGALGAGAAGAAPAAVPAAAPTVGTAGLKAAVASLPQTAAYKIAAVTAPSAAGAAGGITAGKALMASSLLTTGGNIVSGYAKAKAADKEQKRLEENSETPLNVYEGFKEQAASKLEAAKPQNVEPAEPKAYNAATNQWAPVQKASVKGKTAAPTDRQATNTDRRAG